MVVLLTIVHIVVCLFLVIVVLLQSGKAADLAGAFGGMGSQTAFGPRGAATLLSKATTVAAVVFMLTSITLGVLQTMTIGTGQSVIERTGTEGAAPETTAPEAAETPGQPPASAPAGQTAAPASQAPVVDITPAEEGAGSIDVNTGGAPPKPQEKKP